MVDENVHETNGPRLAGQQTVRRAVEVLFALAAERPALSTGEVAARLGLNRTTAWRYLQTLAGTGLVVDLGDGRFTLGSRTVGLAEAYTRQWGEVDLVAGAALVRLRDEVGETAALHLRQGWARVVVRQVESRHELHRTYRELGQPISLLLGAPSRAILAALPPHELGRYLDDRRVEDGPEPDRAALAAELAAIRAAGYASSRGARVPGVASVAAALREPGGQVVGAINVTGPAHRLPEDAVERVAAAVTAAAAWIEDRLAAEGPASS